MIELKKYILLLTALILIASQNLHSQWAILKSDADSLIKLGSEYIYDMKFDKASESFRKVIKDYPDNPAGYFLDAMVEWWKIAIFRNSREYDNIFLNKIEKVLNVCDKVLDTNQLDLGALFFKGGALGYRGRFYVIRNSWFKAASDGYNAFEILLKCLQAAPNNHDIMLGTGIYNYFAEALPEQYPAIKPLLLFAPKGDKKLALLQLEASAKYARYANVEAKVVLLQIYHEFERDTYKALQLAEELHKSYPNNPFFHRYLGRAYVNVWDIQKWDSTWRKILVNYMDKKPGYDDITAREALYYIGTALMQKGDYENALKYFYKCDEASRTLDKDGASGFMIATNLKIGKIYDLQGKRKYAIMQYNKILSWKDFQNSHYEAQTYLNKPYGQR